MKQICHTYLYGDIVNFQANDVEFWGCVSLTTIKNAVQLVPDAEEVIVHIHSCGGDLFEALAIFDYLVSLKAAGIKVTTIVEGICASAATVVFLAGDDRKLMENCRFLIHNPSSWADGTAVEIQRVATFLVDEQERLVVFYVKQTGGDAEVLQALMDEDKFVDADTALELKFATEIVPTMNALASATNRAHQQLILNSFNNKIKNKMNAQKKTKTKGLVASITALLAKITNEGEADNATASSLTLDDETVIYFAEAEIAVGVDVFTDEAMTIPVADGDYLYNDGDTLTVADGSVTVITPATSNETPEEAVARLTTELTAANKRADDNEAVVDELTAQLEAVAPILAKVKSTHVPAARTVQVAKAGTSTAAKKTTATTTTSLKDQVAAEKLLRKGTAKK